MNFIEWAQRRLGAHGFAPKGNNPYDGVYGRNTMVAIRAFQLARGFRVTGTLNPETVEELRQEEAPLLGQPKPVPAAAPKPTLQEQYPWMALAYKKKGLRETDPLLKQFLKSDGKTLGDPAKLPWCGDFIETCVAVVMPNEPLPTNPYLARNWSKFGEACDPGYGAVMPFWRGTKNGVNGHVAFYVGEDDTAYHVIGGNQSNAVTVTRIAKNRLLGARWPLSFTGPVGKRVKLTADGKLSTNEA